MLPSLAVGRGGLRGLYGAASLSPNHARMTAVLSFLSRQYGCAPVAAYSSTTCCCRESSSRSACPARAICPCSTRCTMSAIVCRQEGGAAYMAEAYGKLTGRPGIVFVTRGPGASNAAIGIHTAAQDSTPLIVFVGQVGTDFADREAFQEIDYRRMYGSIAKWVAQIDRVERLPEYVARAFRVATSGRPGPV